MNNFNEIKEVCDNVNEKANCDIKAGAQNRNGCSIVIYDSNSYDELFGFQILETIEVDENEIDKSIEFEVLTKIAKISGEAIWTAIQKS